MKDVQSRIRAESSHAVFQHEIVRVRVMLVRIEDQVFIGQRLHQLPVARGRPMKQHDLLKPVEAPVWVVGIDIRSVYAPGRSEEHTSELQSPYHLVCRRLLEE